MNDLYQRTIETSLSQRIDMNCPTREERSIMRALNSDRAGPARFYHVMIGKMMFHEGTDSQMEDLGRARADFSVGRIDRKAFDEAVRHCADGSERLSQYLKASDAMDQSHEGNIENNRARLAVAELRMMKASPDIADIALAATSAGLKQSSPASFSHEAHDARWRSGFNISADMLAIHLDSDRGDVISRAFRSTPGRASELRDSIGVDRGEGGGFFVRKNDNYMFLDACHFSMESSLEAKNAAYQSPGLWQREPLAVRQRRTLELSAMADDYVDAVGKNPVSAKSREIATSRAFVERGRRLSEDKKSASSSLSP